MSTQGPAETAEGSGRYRYAAQRQQAILAALRSTGQVNAAGLAEELDVTNETIRKDLIVLERQGLLRRVHGGALPVEGLSFEPEVGARLDYGQEKQRIARAALAHVPMGGSVLIDAGSTTTKLAEIFPADRELTVFTNTLPIALALVTRPNLTVYTIGGRLRGRTLATVEGWAARALTEINADVAFLGTNGISLERGLTTPDPAEAAVKQLMAGCAQRRILLADSSKIGRVSLCRHAELTEIDTLITDTGITTADATALRRAGLTVEQA
ncbi:DeoR/GlpR family DNA-binding transcription regulator [Amycolatopsis acidiphila]|uniref:Lactose phosphotransferase system repressor n=1 Tax=Amycolatopsis acidiphila TaxID=715473 RepID=A0A558ACC6_9PSEU|nr:DeoR/GlpR family DNA-binding transcription regulator [Amycolatopsis acidiphila]TVT21922.1 DeoR/GlpR transcriptional regulator [Amycolatopsis acidiphila]UIJ57344.1 DeoR/GlpR family DNA-binding transcription regulator [Amycolatopsis acidiphila]GHG84691.1 DeoR family transcriptional regulator [Amycolatopsis acidiphila]